MIYSDFHFHSTHSGDGEASMVEMIERGIELGLRILCFTEHMDFDYDPQCDVNFLLNTEDYWKEFLHYREVYKDRIDLRFGVELGLQPHLAEGHEKYLKEYPFDFVIGSSHLVHGIDPYYPKFFQDRTENDCYFEYFESILENIDAFQGFDVYGHIDYIVRYYPSRKENYSFREYGDIIDEILKKIIFIGKGIEVNTGGFKYKLDHPNPHEDILKRYKELGGEIITVGSDAHTTEYLGYEFSRTCEILKDAGFRYYTVFKDRKSEFLKL
ncbi:MAG: histidinol-phosphatase HisJ family protein [Lachnospiraceae bacterium]|nr:histidinol-phosphatase HisJ family protein [Lachnospiraceae bacterium]